jgi:hypothetical protein
MILHRDLKPENGKRVRCVWFENVLTANSLPRCGQLRQVGRLWPVKNNAITWLCFNVCRDAVLHVTRDLCGRAIYP